MGSYDVAPCNNRKNKEMVSVISELMIHTAFLVAAFYGDKPSVAMERDFNVRQKADYLT
jgi:hypothetical protein